MTIPKVLDYEITSLAELVTAYPDVVDIQRAKVLDLGRAQEKAGRKAEEIQVPGVRFFKRNSVAGR